MYDFTGGMQHSYTAPASSLIIDFSPLLWPVEYAGALLVADDQLEFGRGRAIVQFLRKSEISLEMLLRRGLFF